jgi:hypothetical protein
MYRAHGSCTLNCLLSANFNGHTMKNITFSADEALIEAARQTARADNTTLNEQFRLWLAQYAQSRQRAQQAVAGMAVLERIRSYTGTDGRKFTRDEMNER